VNSATAAALSVGRRRLSSMSAVWCRAELEVPASCSRSSYRRVGARRGCQATGSVHVPRRWPCGHHPLLILHCAGHPTPSAVQRLRPCVEGSRRRLIRTMGRSAQRSKGGADSRRLVAGDMSGAERPGVLISLLPMSPSNDCNGSRADDQRGRMETLARHPFGVTVE
jgi:hypothetical protein